MSNHPNRIVLDDVEYLRADVVKQPAVNSDGLPYVIIRSRDAGVHAGYLVKRESETSVVLADSRRLWYWSGAATLSQLSIDGVSKPDQCKFPAAVASITIIGVCEIIPATDVARRSVEGVPVWRA